MVLEKSEGEIKREIMQYLSRLSEGMFWINSSIGIRGRKINSRYQLTGVGDILGLYRGRFVAIEVKKPTGVVSEVQEKFIQRVTSKGGLAFVARSLEDVVKLLKTGND